MWRVAAAVVVLVSSPHGLCDGNSHFLAIDHTHLVHHGRQLVLEQTSSFLRSTVLSRAPDVNEVHNDPGVRQRVDKVLACELAALVGNDELRGAVVGNP